MSEQPNRVKVIYKASVVTEAPQQKVFFKPETQPVNHEQSVEIRQLKEKVKYQDMDKRRLQKRIDELEALLADTPEGRLIRLEQYGCELKEALSE